MPSVTVCLIPVIHARDQSTAPCTGGLIHAHTTNPRIKMTRIPSPCVMPTSAQTGFPPRPHAILRFANTACFIQPSRNRLQMARVDAIMPTAQVIKLLVCLLHQREIQNTVSQPCRSAPMDTTIPTLVLRSCPDPATHTTCTRSRVINDDLGPDTLRQSGITP